MVKGVGEEKTLKNIVQVSGWQSGAMALDKDGDVYAWGWNGNGMLANGKVESRSALVPEKTMLSKIVELSTIADSGYARQYGEVEVIVTPAVPGSGTDPGTPAVTEKKMMDRVLSWGYGHNGEWGTGKTGDAQ